MVEKLVKMGYSFGLKEEKGEYEGDVLTLSFERHTCDMIRFLLKHGATFCPEFDWTKILRSFWELDDVEERTTKLLILHSLGIDWTKQFPKWLDYYLFQGVREPLHKIFLRCNLNCQHGLNQVFKKGTYQYRKSWLSKNIGKYM